MPYIEKKRRENLIYWLLDRGGTPPKTAGELNFVLTYIVHEHLKANGTSYQVMNDILGAFEGAKLEFYRRKVAPYEDVKIAENGDI